MTRFVRRAIAFAAVTIIGIPAWAQGSSSLRGVITDPQQSVVVAAKVTLTDKDTGLTRSVITLDTGQYQFLQIRPGSYALTVESPGFSIAKVEASRF